MNPLRVAILWTDSVAFGMMAFDACPAQEFRGRGLVARSCLHARAGQVVQPTSCLILVDKFRGNSTPVSHDAEVIDSDTECFPIPKSVNQQTKVTLAFFDGPQVYDDRKSIRFNNDRFDPNG